jgi:hypothetical protein
MEPKHTTKYLERVLTMGTFEAARAYRLTLRRWLKAAVEAQRDLKYALLQPSLSKPRRAFALVRARQLKYAVTALCTVQAHGRGRGHAEPRQGWSQHKRTLKALVALLNDGSPQWRGQLTLDEVLTLLPYYEA